MEPKEFKNPRAAVYAGWDDVPWLDEDSKAEILASTPPHLRAAVSKGIPSIGEGAVYPLPVEDVVLPAERIFQIPHHFKRLYGMDVGWNRTAVIWLALNPDTDELYAYKEYYQGKMEPEIHAAAIKREGDWIRGVIDPAARTRSQIDGESLLRIYNSPALGMRLTPADNSLEAGIAKIWGRLSTGRLKFFPNCVNLINEYLLYQRDEHGKIVKEHDHALDALRYGVNMLHLASAVPTGGGRTHYTRIGSSNPGSRRYNV